MKLLAYLITRGGRRFTLTWVGEPTVLQEKLVFAATKKNTRILWFITMRPGSRASIPTE